MVKCFETDRSLEFEYVLRSQEGGCIRTPGYTQDPRVHKETMETVFSANLNQRYNNGFLMAHEGRNNNVLYFKNFSKKYWVHYYNI